MRFNSFYELNTQFLLILKPTYPINSIFRFDFRHFRGDLFGGITAGIVALPLALAFGVSSGQGPSAGLYGVIFVSFFAALFGGTPTQIS